MHPALPDGLSAFFHEQLDAETRALLTAPDTPIRLTRVAFVSRDRVRLLGVTDMGQLGQVFDPEDPTVVGDWVLVDTRADPPLVTRRLERTGVLRRRRPLGGVQPVAANLDLALVCTAMGEDLNLRRVERWLALCAEARVPALVVLTKADPDRDAGPSIARLEETGAEVVAVSGLHGTGVSVRDARARADRPPRLQRCRQVDAAQCPVRSGDPGDRWRARATKGPAHDDRAPACAPEGLVDNPGVREVGLVDRAA